MPYNLYNAGSGSNATTTVQYCVTLTESPTTPGSYSFGLISATITPIPLTWDYLSSTIQCPETLKLATKSIDDVNRLVIDEEEGVETNVYFCNLTFRTSTGALTAVAVDCYYGPKYVAYNPATSPAAAPANAPHIYNYTQTAKPQIATLENSNDIVAKVNIIK